MKHFALNILSYNSGFLHLYVLKTFLDMIFRQLNVQVQIDRFIASLKHCYGLLFAMLAPSSYILRTADELYTHGQHSCYQAY